MVSRRRKIVLVVVSILALCGIGLVGFVGFVLYFFGHVGFDPADFDPMAFDSATWKVSPSEFSYDSIRLRMVDDFLKAHHPVGKSRAEIVAVLGEPDDTP